MSATIDNRVVSMEFDNKHFESNVKTSMNTLESLKKSLNLTGAAKGLENIDSAAKGVNMSVLGNAVDTVQAKFSALGVMAVTTLANITNSAVNAGKRMVSALTIDPIKTGLQEYETQINAVQTILANTQSKGTTLDQVNSALDELNAYADKTIYNFTEMTRNIGTFTAAGVDLETSVASIQGIANLAAVSGSTSQQASTAMYQLSQALAAGKVSLMDWNSVVNAGMGGQLFQDALIRTATNMGTNVDALIDKYGSFRESLTQGEWLTTEVLTETLKQLSGAYTEADLIAQGYTEEQAREIAALADTAVQAATKVKTFTQLVDTLKEAAQSGWTQTWEILIGDFEEAKALWTAVSDELGAVIGASAEQRNSMLQGWADEGGRAMLIESLSNAYQGLKAVITAVSEAFREVFPPMTSEQLLKFTEGIKNLSERFREFSETHAAKFKSTFKGIFSIIDICVTVIKAVASGIATLIGKFTGLAGGVLTVTGSIGDWLSGLRDSVKEADIFGKAINAIVGFLGAAIDKIKEFGGYLKSKFSAPGFEGFLNVLESIWGLIKTVGSKIVEVAGSIGRALSDALSFDNLSSALDIASGGIFVGILLGIKKFINGITEAFGTSEDGFLGTIKGAFEGVVDTLNAVGESLQAWQQNLQAGTLQKIAIAIGILAAALLVLSLIDPAKLTTALSGITVLFAELMGSLAIFNKIGMLDKGVVKSVIAMIGIASAVLILAGALKMIASLDMNQMMTGLLGVAGLMAIVVVAMNKLARDDGAVVKGGMQLILISVALKILASVCKDLGSLSWEELAKGLSGVAGVLLIFVVFQDLMSRIVPHKMMTSAMSLVIIGAAMEIFADACSKFGAMEWGSLAKAGAAMLGILALAAGFVLLADLAFDIYGSVISLTIMAAAMEIFADVCSKFGAMSWESLAKAGAAIAGVLALAAGFVLLADLAFDIYGSVIALAIMSVAMELFADVCNKFGSMKWEELAKAGTAIAGILVLAAGFALLAGLAIDIIGSAAALVIMAVALNMLTPVLTKLGSMSWGDVAKGLIAIAGAFTIIGLAGYLLAPIVPAIIALSGAIALLGLGCLAAGAGILALGAGLGALAAAGVGAASALVASLQIIIGGLIDLIPMVIQKIGEGIILLCDVIAGSVESIGRAVKAIVLTIVDVLVECIPAIAQGAMQLILGVLDALGTYAPQIVAGLFQFIISIFDGIATHMPELIQAFVGILASIFEGAAEALKNIDPKTFMQGVLSVGMLAGMVAALAAVAALVPAAMVGALGVTAVLAELGLIAQIPGLDWLINESAGLMESIGKAVGGFIGGLSGGIMEGVTGSLPEVGTNLSTFMENLQPFIEGAKSIDSTLADGILALSQMILTLTGANILDSITSWATGGSSLSDFAAQLVPFGKSMREFADEVSGIDSSAVSSAATAGQAIAELASALPNSGGVAGFFAGENDMDIFAAQLVPFGRAIRQFATQVAGVDVEAVSNAAKAGAAIADMASIIPNEGGMVAWFTGENSVAAFGSELVSLGEGLKGFAESVAGVDCEGIVAAATAAKSLADMAAVVPNEGGMSAWFAGENSVAVFAGNLRLLGLGLKGFSEVTEGIVPESITAAANAAKALADMTAVIPNEGGMAAWFAGDNSIATFSSNLVLLGEGLCGFGTAVEGVVPSNIMAAANAAKSLAEMSNVIPNEGGVAAWFAGDNSIASFANKLPTLGEGLKGFSDSVAGINAGNITAAANAAKSLADMTATIPKNTDKIVDFGDNLIDFGESLNEYFEATSGISSATVSAATGAIECVKSAESLSASSISSAAEAIQSMVDALNNMATVSPSTASGFAETMKELGTVSADSFVSAFKAIEDDMGTCGTQAIDKFVSAVRNNNSLVSGCNVMVAKATAAIRVKYSGFYSAGQYLVQGFANGISSYTFLAAAKARAMANAAEQAAKAALDSHSPSRVFIEIGKYVPQGFAIGISALGNKVKNAASGMANTALDGTKNVMSRIANALDSDMDMQPTIRPVLDLSEVSAGASSINGLLSMNPSVGVQGTLSSINSAMNRRLQNGADSEVVTAINKLRKDVGNLENRSYSVGSISYSSGDEVSTALEGLIRAIRVEGRA